ncbi:MAG: restriction endonuclease [Planctomycetes bacterium]|nr:restriction endonuclease [Planctomycetota bacterium]
MARPAGFVQDRIDYHAMLLKNVLSIDSNGVPSNADKHNANSVRISLGIAQRLRSEVESERLAGQTSGSRFEDACADFVKTTFLKLKHLRPGEWDIHKVGNRDSLAIAKFEQYAHLIALDRATRDNPELAAALGSDYTITPDIVVVRDTVTDKQINSPKPLVDETVANLASIRKQNGGSALLHASISCKWTIRSDRAQNSRSEALNLIRNRKGRLPHIMVVTAEPIPARLASIALGTGDIDCVYHFALHELRDTVVELGLHDAFELLSIMIDGKRLKDISDLPLDLAV